MILYHSELSILLKGNTIQYVKVSAVYAIIIRQDLQYMVYNCLLLMVICSRYLLLVTLTHVSSHSQSQSAGTAEQHIINTVSTRNRVYRPAITKYSEEGRQFYVISGCTFPREKANFKQQWTQQTLPRYFSAVKPLAQTKNKKGS